MQNLWDAAVERIQAIWETWRDNVIELSAITALLAFICVLLAALFYGPVTECEAKWRDSGFETRYVRYQCQVEVAEGVWFPSDAVVIVVTEESK